MILSQHFDMINILQFFFVSDEYKTLLRQGITYKTDAQCRLLNRNVMQSCSTYKLNEHLRKEGPLNCSAWFNSAKNCGGIRLTTLNGNQTSCVPGYNGVDCKCTKYQFQQ